MPSSLFRSHLRRRRRSRDERDGKLTVGLDVANLGLSALSAYTPDGRCDLATMVPADCEVWLDNKRIHPRACHPAQRLVDELERAGRATAIAAAAELEDRRGVFDHESAAAPTATKALSCEKNRAKIVENDNHEEPRRAIERFDALCGRVRRLAAEHEVGTRVGSALNGVYCDLIELRRFADLLPVFDDIAGERFRQNLEWGQQDHDAAGWLAILTEEVGEVAQEICRSMGRALDVQAYRAELVQVAAVATQAIECIDRQGGRHG